MGKIIVDFTKSVGVVKPMHAVNNAPSTPAGSPRGNFETFAEAGIPLVRNHDASLSEAYGSQHAVDVHCIFPDFSRDADDESAYDFTITDAYTKNILDTGAKVFYRLGASIEHWPKKYGTLVPTDFAKWASVCEHIIRHCNEGWANGFNFGIEYWEIWNEADLDDDDCPDKRTWGGTKREFFDFYEVASKHLKGCFPTLKIGGPALAFREDWCDEFLGEMKKRGVSLDFFSWHIYCTQPEPMMQKAQRLKDMLVRHGYENAECILNEWNYVHDWNDPLGYIKVIKSIKGASFCTSCICEAQKSDCIDILMYYDARIEKVWNGMFDSDTLLPLKGYYPFRMFNELYKLGISCKCETDSDRLFAVSAKSESGDEAILFCRYNDNDDGTPEEVELCINGGNGEYDVYLLDEEKNAELVGKAKSGDKLCVKPYSVYLLKTAE